jgi:DNA-binding IclR family transcriptional regulator
MLATEATVTDWVSLIRGEYEEMPGLVLSCAQACRMWGIDRATCRAVMDALIRSGFLVQRPDGAYGGPTALSLTGCSLKEAP